MHTWMTVIFSNNWDKHLIHIDIVLNRFQQHGLTVKPSKCQWGSTSIEFLGHVAGDGHISVPDCRVQAIRDYKKPVNQRDLRSFLGIIGYYRHFIKDYAQHSIHLTNATRKSVPVELVWSDEMYNEFLYLCNVLADTCSLIVPQDSDTYVLQTDASVKGISGILSVIRDKELPVEFYSRKLTAAEQNYAATELEGLAVVAAILQFEVYLIGRHFVVQTDHRALTFLDSAKHLNPRLTRWCLRLQQFTFTVRYRPGKQNINADALSRQAWIDSGGPLHSTGRGRCKDQPPTKETEKHPDKLS